MQTTAEIIWKDKEEPLVFLDSLKEAHLFFLEGMTNGVKYENLLGVACLIYLVVHLIQQIDHITCLEAADAKKQYPELYTKWREDPANFHVNGIYPLTELWGRARQAWEQILLTPVYVHLSYFSSGSRCVIVCPWLSWGFDPFFFFLGDDREKTSWWLHTSPFCARSSAQR